MFRFMERIICQFVRNSYCDRAAVHYRLELVGDSPIGMIDKIPDHAIAAGIAPVVFRLGMRVIQERRYIAGRIPWTIDRCIADHIAIIPFPDDIRMI